MGLARRAQGARRKRCGAIVDDEQRRDRRATPMRPLGSGLAGASAALALLDDVHRHRLRRAALHLPPPGQERGHFYYSDRLLERNNRAKQYRS